jgi:DNA modification methylase
MKFESKIYCGDASAVLKTLPTASVQMVCSSPPYWGLRDYGTAKWEGGDKNCDHKQDVKPRASRPSKGLTGGKDTVDAGTAVFKEVCQHCGAHRIDQQLGLERTPELFIQHLVAVFREVHRVLKDDGVIWVNLGDSWFSTTKTSGRNDEGRKAAHGINAQG